MTNYMVMLKKGQSFMLKGLFYANYFSNISCFINKYNYKIYYRIIIGVIGIILPCVCFADWSIDIYDSPTYKDKSVIVVTKDSGEECKMLIKSSEIRKKRKQIYEWFAGLSKTNCGVKNSGSGDE